jgi:hypothetical protein
MKKLLLIISLLTIIQISCNSSDEGFTPTLPPETKTGANTFGVTINGKVYITYPLVRVSA